MTEKASASGRGGAGHEGIAFFAKVSAVISHEMNNVLATMQENAGLLQDHLNLAAQGRELSTESLQRAATRMKAQVERGQDIVAAMNRFAHSGDEALGEVDLGETLEMMCFLFGRPAASRGVRLETRAPSSQATILTYPFLLEDVLWRCLDFATQHTSDARCCTIAAGAGHDEKVMVEIGGLGSVAPETLAAWAGGEIKALLSDLGAILEPVQGGQGIIIYLTNRAGREN